MTPTYIHRIGRIYAALDRALPLPSVAARRLLEEAVELCLAAGTRPGDIILGVTDALANEAMKQGCRPSTILPASPVPGDIAGEIADVAMLTALVKHLAHVGDDEITAARDTKLERLETAIAAGRLIITPDGRLYRRPEPEEE